MVPSKEMQLQAVRIKEMREMAGLKQIGLARICGVGQSAVSSWEVGTATPRPDALKKLCDYFNVSSDYVLGIEDAGNTEEIAGIDFALSGAIRDLSEPEKQDVLDYIRFKRAQKNKQ